jgi:hypothetical protein
MLFHIWTGPPLWFSGQSSWLQNGDVLWFLWGTNWIYICYVEESRPSLWSSGQSSWLLIQSSGIDSWRYQIFWEVVGLERGPLSLVSTIEELLERKSSGSGLETENTVVGSGHADHVAPSFHKRWNYLLRQAKRRSFCWHSSLADSGHGVLFLHIWTASVKFYSRNG